MVKKLLEKNRKKRLSLEEILRHPWFKNFDIQKERQDPKDVTKKFEAFALTENNKEKITYD